MAPRVSVLIPCHNLGHFLPETIASVHSQTFQDYEILVVDDGSTDEETRRVLDSSWARTQVCRTAHRGLAAARNDLLRRAAGEYVCALDADDKLHPEFLQRTVAVLDARPDLAFVSTHLQMFGTEDRLWPDVARCDLEMLLCDDTVITAALVRRGAVDAAGGYDEQMPEQGDEDWDLWIRLVAAGQHGVILPEVLFYYRRRDGSMVTQCTRGEPHLKLTEYLARKHEPHYRQHLEAVLTWKESRISALRRANIALEDEIGGFLGPAVARRHGELEHLRRRLEDLDAPAGAMSAPGERRVDAPSHASELEVLRAECARSRREVTDLRASASWRLTGPLRWCYDVARAAMGRRR